MARQLRVQFPGAIYHLATIPDGRKPIFHDQLHYERMTSGLKEEVTRSGWKVFAFYWMPNPIHVPLQTPEPNLSWAMQHWLSGHANSYAKRNRRVGHLFQGRYKAILVEDAGYFWSRSRTIHVNPCSGTRPLAATPDQWKHSSYLGYARKTAQVDWLHCEELHAYWAAANKSRKGHPKFMDSETALMSKS